jgi:hypothetical protein
MLNILSMLISGDITTCLPLPKPGSLSKKYSINVISGFRLSNDIFTKVLRCVILHEPFSLMALTYKVCKPSDKSAVGMKNFLSANSAAGLIFIGVAIRKPGSLLMKYSKATTFDISSAFIPSTSKLILCVVLHFPSISSERMYNVCAPSVN